MTAADVEGPRAGTSNGTTVLAEYFVTDTLTLLYIVRSDFEAPVVEAFDLGSRELRPWVMDNFGPAPADTSSAFDEKEFQAVVGPLVEPVLAWTEPDDVVWFVPHDVLHYLPLHAAPVDGGHLIDRNAVCYTPSASVMEHCQRNRTGRMSRALVVGDSLGDLPHAREEAALVGGLFQVAPYVGPDASKGAVLELLERDGRRLDVLHVACHGIFDPEEPLRSGIVLGGPGDPSGDPGDEAVLTAEELLDVQLRAELVVLSACESGVNDRHPGDELTGLTRALLHAGTSAVIVSLWPVDDQSTSMLMERFYGELMGAGAGPGSGRRRRSTRRRPHKAQALRRAQTALRDLTARQLVDWCTGRLEALSGELAAPERAALHLDAAAAHAAAGGGREARREMAAAGQVIGNLRAAEAADPRAGHAAAALEDRMQSIRPVRRRGRRPDYTARPFEHPHHWAPFVLVGDWR